MTVCSSSHTDRPDISGFAWPCFGLTSYLGEALRDITPIRRQHHPRTMQHHVRRGRRSDLEPVDAHDANVYPRLARSRATHHHQSLLSNRSYMGASIPQAPLTTLASRSAQPILSNEAFHHANATTSPHQT